MEGSSMEGARIKGFQMSCIMQSDNLAKCTFKKRMVKGMKESILSYEDLLQIVQLINSSSQCVEFNLKFGDIQIETRKKNTDVKIANIEESTTYRKTNEPKETLDVVATEPKETPDLVATESIPPESKNVKSPMVGTFYRSPEPKAPAFVEVGQHVKEDDTVCIIEVMKLFNSISAGYSGTVTHILVNDAEPVEYGQVLIVIDPD